MMIFHKPFCGYIVGCTLGAFITVTCKKLLSDAFSYTVYGISTMYISKLASTDFEAGSFKGEPHNECAIHDFIGSCELKSKHPKADCLS